MELDVRSIHTSDIRGAMGRVEELDFTILSGIVNTYRIQSCVERRGKEMGLMSNMRTNTTQGGGEESELGGSLNVCLGDGSQASKGRVQGNH